MVEHLVDAWPLDKLELGVGAFAPVCTPGLANELSIV